MEMPRGLPFSVDTWTSNSERKRHHFLTHAHSDHCVGISACSSSPIYSTHLTKALILHYYPKLDGSLFVCVEIGQSIVIRDMDGEFTVTAFDANHCPGAVMFLFEGYFGNILHTGDCRLTAECLHYLPEKYISKKGEKPRCQLDVIFLDCTFAKFSQKFPPIHSAIQQVISCIWKHPDAALVYLACGSLGQEDILVEVSKAFGSKIFVDHATMADIYHALKLNVPDIITRDHSSRFHLLGAFPRLQEQAAAKIAEAEANFQPAPLIVRPSAQWYARQEGMKQGGRRKLRVDEAVKDQIGVWHVCFARHSSKEEIEWALQLLLPRWVVSTTPASCRAMELDYATKHCFGKAFNSTDHRPIWKILDLDMDACVAVADASTTDVTSFPVLEEPSSDLPSDVCPTQAKSPLTLFGRAGLDVVESKFHIEKKNPSLSLEANCVRDPPMATSSSFITSAACYSETLRKLYRSTNVSVPRPLPSLVELRCKTKRAHKKDDNN